MAEADDERPDIEVVADPDDFMVMINKNQLVKLMMEKVRLEERVKELEA